MYGAAVEVLSIDFCRFCPVRAEPAAVISPPFLAVLLRFQRLSRAFHYLSFCRFCPACAEPVGTEPLSAPAHCSCRPPLCSALLSSLPLLAAAILPLSSPPLICLSPHPCPPLQPFPTAAPLRPHGRAGTGGLRRGLLKRHDLSLPLRGIRATGCALSARRGGSADSVGPVVRSRTLLNTPNISTDSFFKREVCWYRSTHRPGVLFGLDTQVAPRRTPHRPTQPDALRAVCATASSAAYPTAPSRAVGHRQIELWPPAQTARVSSLVQSTVHAWDLLSKDSLAEAGRAPAVSKRLVEPHEPQAVAMEVPRDGGAALAGEADAGDSAVLVGFGNGSVDVHYIDKQLVPPPPPPPTARPLLAAPSNGLAEMCGAAAACGCVLCAGRAAGWGSGCGPDGRDARGALSAAGGQGGTRVIPVAGFLQPRRCACLRYLRRGRQSNIGSRRQPPVPYTTAFTIREAISVTWP